MILYLATLVIVDASHIAFCQFDDFGFVFATANHFCLRRLNIRVYGVSSFKFQEKPLISAKRKVTQAPEKLDHRQQVLNVKILIKFLNSLSEVKLV